MNNSQYKNEYEDYNLGHKYKKMYSGGCYYSIGKDFQNNKHNIEVMKFNRKNYDY